MTCHNCVKHVTEALRGVDGVSRVEVDLSAARATVEVGDHVIADALVAALSDEGYESSAA
ncbi:MAG: heavy-metal-associated domain-containing protein [Polyangiaceae bacterium]|nr:heavy-metal-associated domain-containing protein [Polyangiaceae bacterium]